MTLQLRHIKRCQRNHRWYVQLTEWIKPITTSKLKFKKLCFPHRAPWWSLCLGRGWYAEDKCFAHVSLFFYAGAGSHQAEAPESPLPVPLVLQLLQGQQGLRYVLQVLRNSHNHYILTYYFFVLHQRGDLFYLFLGGISCAITVLYNF